MRDAVLEEGAAMINSVFERSLSAWGRELEDTDNGAMLLHLHHGYPTNANATRDVKLKRQQNLLKQCMGHMADYCPASTRVTQDVKNLHNSVTIKTTKKKWIPLEIPSGFNFRSISYYFVNRVCRLDSQHLWSLDSTEKLQCWHTFHTWIGHHRDQALPHCESKQIATLYYTAVVYDKILLLPVTDPASMTALKMEHSCQIRQYTKINTIWKDHSYANGGIDSNLC